VQDDLLRFVSGPTPYSPWWLWIGLGVLTVLIAWYLAVLVWTLPSSQLRRLPVVRSVHARVLRRRYARTVRTIGEHYRAGALPPATAGAQLSRTLRSFLHQATGTRAQYMHVDDIAAGDLAKAAPLVSALNDAQFNTESTVDVGQAGLRAEELIRTWT
jgi:hypothetical protein